MVDVSSEGATACSLGREPQDHGGKKLSKPQSGDRRSTSTGKAHIATETCRPSGARFERKTRKTRGSRPGLFPVAAPRLTPGSDGRGGPSVTSSKSFRPTESQMKRTFYVWFIRNCMKSRIGRMSSRRRRQRQLSDSRAGFSDRFSHSDRGRYGGRWLRSGAATGESYRLEQPTTREQL
jgi:hypothetical protein